jgi:hypothetical protein
MLQSGDIIMEIQVITRNDELFETGRTRPSAMRVQRGEKAS